MAAPAHLKVRRFSRKQRPLPALRRAAFFQLHASRAFNGRAPAHLKVRRLLANSGFYRRYGVLLFSATRFACF
jgi:hypothetical protein